MIWSLAGFGVGMALLMAPWLLGGGGMGDVKMLAALAHGSGRWEFSSPLVWERCWPPLAWSA